VVRGGNNFKFINQIRSEWWAVRCENNFKFINYIVCVKLEKFVLQPYCVTAPNHLKFLALILKLFQIFLLNLNPEIEVLNL
jgi:hypothetical protein